MWSTRMNIKLLRSPLRRFYVRPTEMKETDFTLVGAAWSGYLGNAANCVLFDLIHDDINAGSPASASWSEDSNCARAASVRFAWARMNPRYRAGQDG